MYGFLYLQRNYPAFPINSILLIPANELISKNKIIQSSTDITDEKKWDVNMSSRQLAHIEIDLFTINLKINQILNEF